MNGYIERGDYMGLCESDTLREQALSEYNRKLQKGEECDFDNIYNRLLKLNGLPPIEPTKKTAESETEKEIEPIDDKQRYFWWKFHHNFFDDIAVKRLSKQKDGDTLVLLYIKLINISLKHNGYICYEGTGLDLIDELTLYLDRDIEMCTNLISQLEQYNLIELTNDKKVICIKAFNTYTGADDVKTRMKNSRERNKQVKN